MILKTIDQKIRKAFSNAAVYYDILTSLHKEIGRDLIKKILPLASVETILDVGMGTGWLTQRLPHYFPGSIVTGVDFAPGMIEAAQRQNEEGFHIVEAHAGRLPFKKESFDLIISNLAYHWIDDLPQAFQECRRNLKSDGTLGVTMCGRQTFDELFTALENTQTQENNRPMAIRRLPSKEQISQALEQTGFENAEVKEERIKIRFPDMMALVQWTKDIGANALEKDIYIGRDWLSRANEYYRQHFQDRFGIYATFEVVWVVAKK